MFGKKSVQQKIVITKNGPYAVSGRLPLDKEIIVSDENGDPVKWGKGEAYPTQKSYDLCRCGESKNKPFCDHTHLSIKFDGTETASRKNYLEEVEKTSGPALELTDNVKLCASARFCFRKTGTWKLTENSNDPASKELAIDQACNCPSGRLVAWEKETGQAIEPQHELSITIVEDPEKKVSGSIWVKGKVPIVSSSGFEYETRNRVALCRCGKSNNKPFCDGKHIDSGFQDGDQSLN